MNLAKGRECFVGPSMFLVYDGTYWYPGRSKIRPIKKRFYCTVHQSNLTVAWKNERPSHMLYCKSFFLVTLSLYRDLGNLAFLKLYCIAIVYIYPVIVVGPKLEQNSCTVSPRPS